MLTEAEFTQCLGTLINRLYNKLQLLDDLIKEYLFLINSRKVGWAVGKKGISEQTPCLRTVCRKT